MFSENSISKTKIRWAARGSGRRSGLSKGRTDEVGKGQKIVGQVDGRDGSTFLFWFWTVVMMKSVWLIRRTLKLKLRRRKQLQCSLSLALLSWASVRFVNASKVAVDLSVVHLKLGSCHYVASLLALSLFPLLLHCAVIALHSALSWCGFTARTTESSNGNDVPEKLTQILRSPERCNQVSFWMHRQRH